MNRYKYVTRHHRAEDIEPCVQTEISRHAGSHQLGDVLGAVVSCCETSSVPFDNPKSGIGGNLARLLGRHEPDRPYRSVIAFTDRYLIVARVMESRGISVLSARLDGASLRRREGENDFGMNVSAAWSAHREIGSLYIGLGNDTDGQIFANELEKAVTAAKAA